MLLCSWDSPGKNTRVDPPPPGNLTDTGIGPVSLISPALAGGFFTTSTTWEAPWSLQNMDNAMRLFKKIFIFIYLAVLGLSCGM